jgi:hypothetical protein
MEKDCPKGRKWVTGIRKMEKLRANCHHKWTPQREPGFPHCPDNPNGLVWVKKGGGLYGYDFLECKFCEMTYRGEIKTAPQFGKVRICPECKGGGIIKI